MIQRAAWAHWRYELGNVYHLAGYEPSNQSALFGMLQNDLDTIAAHPGLNVEAVLRCLASIDEVMTIMQNERMTRPDASLIRDEFRLTARMMQHACHRGMTAAAQASAPSMSELISDIEEIIQDYRVIWLKRNRPGGMADSISRFKKILAEYQSKNKLA